VNAFQGNVSLKTGNTSPLRIALYFVADELSSRSHEIVLIKRCVRKQMRGGSKDA